jgi:arylsulfatase A-like enzyme
MVRTILTLVAVAALAASATADTPRKPNVVVVVADDMGWRDTGYRGNSVVKTPHLDDMAAKGVRFDYFYPGQQMCSPGRFAIMCGRNPFRTGLHHLGAMRPQEVTLARILKDAGYATAQFGKWHLGGGNTSPAKVGFDRAVWAINYFDLGASLQVGDTKEKVELKGDTSVATMGLALDWIRGRAKEPAPFFAYVCFGSPHAPHRAADEFKALYKDLPEKKQDYWGEVSGVDAAVGNLRAELKKLGIADNTIVWFTSDNGGITPESQDPSGKGKMTVGCRTQGLLEWPAVVKAPIATSLPCAHVDILPTTLSAVGVKYTDARPLDGIDLLPLIKGREMKERGKPLGFLLWNGKGNFAQVDFLTDVQGVWIDGNHKLVVEPNGGAVKLYDIVTDPAHKTDLAPKMPDRVEAMRAALDEWRKGVRASFDGKDYPKK